MAPLVYVLGATTALAVAWLLMRGYGRSGARFLLWSGLCFAGLAVNNALVFVDLVLVPDIDLYTWRNLAAVAAMAVLVYGLIWDVK